LLNPSLNYFCFTEKFFNFQQLAKLDADILMLIGKIVIYYFRQSYIARNYLLTPRCRVPPEQLTGLQLVKKFPASHGTRRFITALTSVGKIVIYYFRQSYIARNYLLTPRCRVLPEQLTGLQLVKTFPASHGTRRIITALTSVGKIVIYYFRQSYIARNFKAAGDDVNDFAVLMFY
jgi:hypothetical protein